MSANQEEDFGPPMVPNVKFRDAAEDGMIQVEIDKKNHRITIEDKQELITHDQHVTRYNLKQYVLPEDTPMEPFRETLDQEVQRVTLAAEEEYDAAQAAQAAKAKVVEQSPQKEVEPEKVEKHPQQNEAEPEKVEEQPAQEVEEQPQQKVEEQPPQNEAEPEKAEEQPAQEVEEQPQQKVEEQPPQPFWKEKIRIPLFRNK